MRVTKPEAGYFIFSAEDVGSYEKAFDSLVSQVREAQKLFTVECISGPSWKMAEDRKSHFVITQTAMLIPVTGGPPEEIKARIARRTGK